MQIAQPEMKAKGPWWQDRNAWTRWVNGPALVDEDPPFLSCAFYTCVGAGSRGGNGRLLDHQVTPKSLFFKELAVPWLQAIQHLERDGSNLHSQNAPKISRETFSLHQLCPVLSLVSTSQAFCLSD